MEATRSGPRSRRSSRLVLLAAAAFGLVPLAGCLDYEETLSVAGDGSGTLSVDLKLDLTFMTEIQKLDPAPDSEDSGDVKNFVTKDEILKDCNVAGVKVDKCEVDEDGPHKTHVKLELAFKDLDSLRAVRSFSDREIMVEDKRADASPAADAIAPSDFAFVYRFSARSIFNLLRMGPDAGEKDEPTEKDKKMREVLDGARKASSARFTLKMPGKLASTTGDKLDDKSARWTIDKAHPKAQAALLTEPLRMEVVLAKKDAPFWEKERDRKKAESGSSKPEGGSREPRADSPQPPKPGKPGDD